MNSKQLVAMIDKIVESKLKKVVNQIVEEKLNEYLGVLLEQKKKKSQPSKSSQIKSKLNQIFEMNEPLEDDSINEYTVTPKFDVDGLPDHLQNALTKNYAPLMNKIKEKKGKF